MDRKRLARIAYIGAADRLVSAAQSGRMDRTQARNKLTALRAAYDKRVGQIELPAFMKANGLGAALSQGAR